MSDKQKLVLSIIDFLNQSINDGTVKDDDKESLEVAVQCIGEAFGVDSTDQAQVERLSIKPASLRTIFDVYVKTRDKVGSGSSQSAAPSAASASTLRAPSADDKVKAEKLKQAGNAQMSTKNYDKAIESYTQAIALDPTNPVYYSNRAAAYSSQNDHLSAVGDAQKAIEVDPKFVKAFSRLGHAQFCLEDFSAAAAAFRKGLELDPTNANLKSGLQNSEARIEDDDEASPEISSPSSTSGTGAAPNFAGMADMLRGMGGGAGRGGGGGMPDLASMMNNPAMMQMAQQMMASGGLESLMQNPGVANMMNRVQSGGPMPSMQEIMSDPTLASLASQFGGGRGAAP